MKSLICYKTKGGATKKYAEWIAEDLNSDILTFSDVKKETFDNYDLVIVSSGTYAGLMPLNRFLKRHWKRLENKRVVVVAVGAAPADDPWSLRSYNRIPEKIRGKIKYFKLMGEDPEMSRPKDYVPKVKKENIKPVLAAIKAI